MKNQRPKTTGIYKITNISNGRVYIGASNRCENRLAEHFKQLKINIHSNSLLQSEYNQYGRESFSREILVKFNKFDSQQLYDNEVYFYNLYKDNSYNINYPTKISINQKTLEIPNDSELRAKFFEKAVPSMECWEWNGAFDRESYAIINYKDKVYKASRVSYFIHVGKQPGDLFLCHKCDNPRCCNPQHLFVGTNQENVNDRVQKGRGRLLWLTWDIIHKIRQEYAIGDTMAKDLENKYGCKLGPILRNESWYDPNYTYIKKFRISKPKQIPKTKKLNVKTYTSSYVAKLFGVSLASICNWCRQGLITDFTRFGNKYLFTIQNVINLRSIFNYIPQESWKYGQCDLYRIKELENKRFKQLTDGKSMNQEAIDYYMDTFRAKCRFYSAAELADKLNLPVKVVYRFYDKGLIKSKRKTYPLKFNEEDMQMIADLRTWDEYADMFS